MSNCLVTLKDINETEKCSVKQKDIQKIERICRLSERYLDENERIFFFAKRREVHDGICDVKEYWKEAEGTKFHWMQYMYIYLFICIFVPSVWEAHCFRNVSLPVLLNHFHFLISYLLTLFIFFISHVRSCNTHLLQKGKSVSFSKNFAILLTE